MYSWTIEDIGSEVSFHYKKRCTYRKFKVESRRLLCRGEVGVEVFYAFSGRSRCSILKIR